MYPHRLSRVGAAVIIALGLSACATAVNATGSPKSSPPPDPLPPNQLVLRVEYTPGYTPLDYHRAYVPYLSVYGDGRVYQVEPRDGDPLSPKLLMAKVDPTVVAELVDELERTGIIDDSTDFGFPNITDVGSTLVTLHGTGDLEEADAYALGYDAEHGLTKSQKERRDKLRAQIEQIKDLADGAQPADPEAVEIRETDPSEVDAVNPPPWPGPDPATFLTDQHPNVAQCGSIAGPEAAKLYTAAATNDGHLWTYNGQERRLIVKILLPGDTPC